MSCLPEHQSIAVEWVRDIPQVEGEKLADKRGEPAAEAKKADGASWVTLRIPKPPDQTRRDAWVHASTLSRRLMLAMDPSKDLCRRSKSSSSEERKQGEVRKMYNFGKENAWRSRQRASWGYRYWNLPPITSKASLFDLMVLSTPVMPNCTKKERKN